MKIEEFTLKSNQDQLELSIALINPSKKAKGIIQISHGMAENKERYYPFMEYLSKHGYVVIIHDHRGHGKSIKTKEDQGFFYDETSNYIVEDLHQVSLFIKERYPNLDLTLFGHSMGSMVVRKYLKKYDHEITRLIVCGSPSKNPAASFALAFVKFLRFFKGAHDRSRLIQKLAFGNYNQGIKDPVSPNAWICSDPDVVRKYEEDDRCGFVFTLNGFQNLFLLMKDIYSLDGWTKKHLDLPILFIAGKEDPVLISEEKWRESQDFLKKIGYQNISSKLYPTMRHEILNEIQKEMVYKDILTWIEKEKID